MVGDWKVSRLPRCTHHVFLSHCAEDRERLVQPVHLGLERARKYPWLDQHHFPLGQDPFEALREAVISCRHVVYFVTTKFLTQGRGWNSVELAYASLLQENLRARKDLCHIQFPLFFVPRANVTLQRSAWSKLEGSFYPPGRVDGSAISWAVSEIVRFIGQEERRGARLAAEVQFNSELKKWQKAEPNLVRRIMCADPFPSE
jgi:hypothetical protein